ncbi:DNA repair protein RecN [Robiginitalea aurantiaca]|uniref:DNA repair protein RecN n=1 Tax=Robiginitalea aurantiaca TaxID=3056915 RepID=A0ABT7WGA7_9FLAO|nr:DNA repair protein RecN [Robiginitalea aurantiaca]MDM9631946.1 DNA repair protein RecN [Robiginitalea aurantiaca]
MLIRLSIKNYALIEDLQVRFQEGFTTITGETGAGKSILLESLGLVLGKRADRSALRDQELKCVVEAEFALDRYPALKTYFTHHDLDYDPLTILRREIQPSGKSRAFVNDSPVTLDVLSGLGSHLIDVHSQHQTLELTDQDFQLHVVDALAGNSELLNRYTADRELMLKTRKELELLKKQQEEAFREQDYNEFLLAELDKADLVIGMQAGLEAEYAELSNAELIRETLENAQQLFQEEQYGLLAVQGQLNQLMGKLSSFGPDYMALQERIKSLYIESDDISEEVNGLLDRQVADPARLGILSSRLELLHNLQKKHSVGQVDDLIAMREALRLKVDQTLDLDAEIQKQELVLENLETNLAVLADTIREKRMEVLPNFVSELRRHLSGLGMPNASFVWELLEKADFGRSGRDVLELKFTANKGGKYGPLKKTASGGELSRIMLTIKAILASYEPLPTMMFDEIDTGVSGDVSARMAEMMEQMSRHMQIFAITHLPQVASRGQQQFKVYKEDEEDRTQTRMKQLSQQERLHELAQMLGGSEITETAISHAREMLN